MPALMVSARHDTVLTPAMAEGMEQRVPDLRKIVIDDVEYLLNKPLRADFAERDLILRQIGVAHLRFDFDGAGDDSKALGRREGDR